MLPKIFNAQLFLMASRILCLQLLCKNPLGAAIALPFLLLNLLIIRLQHPLKPFRYQLGISWKNDHR